MVSTAVLKHTIREKKTKVLIVFEDVIADMVSNKKLHTVVNDLFIRGRKLNISRIHHSHTSRYQMM